MNKRRRILLVGLVLAMLGVISWEVLRPHEPVYKGRPLSAWLKDYDGQYNGIFTTPLAWTWHDADLAVRAMRTNALPILIDELGSRDSPAKVALVNWFNRHVSPKFQLTTEYERHGRALCGIRALGSDARPAIPVLAEYLKRINRPTDWEGFLWLDADSTLANLSTNKVFIASPRAQQSRNTLQQIDSNAAIK